MFRDYYQARLWLESFIPKTYSRKNLGLARIEYLLNLLGRPDKNFKSILIGGTSGKGSTAFYISELLQAKNYKVGLHLSPHLIYLGERMRINGKNISTDKLIDLIEKIRPIVRSMKQSDTGLPSYFEILVALSFQYFSDEKVDFAVVEVGLGGKYDATNVLKPKLSVITNVGLDHTEILGETIEKISYEKAGIIKKGTPILTGADGIALKVIEKEAKKSDSKLIKISTQTDDNLIESDMLNSISGYKKVNKRNEDRFALSNKILAAAAINGIGINIKSDEIKRALKRKLEGRIETVSDKIILDGAHNEDKAKFLISNIKSIYRNSSVVLVIAFKKGKDWKKIVDLLLSELKVVQVVVTEFKAVTDMGSFAAVEANIIVKYIKSKGFLEVTKETNSQKAVIDAINMSADKLLLVTGSLYLVGEVRTMWISPEF